MTDLTRIQRLLWAGQQLDSDVPLYNMALAFELQGPIDARRFERAVRSVIERGDALRTVFITTDGNPRRHVEDGSQWSLDTVDLSAEPDSRAALQSWIAQRVGRRFDLSKPPFDIALIKLGAERTVWFLNQHHLITDGWSTALLYREIEQAYRRSESSTPSNAAPLPLYAEHVEVERSLSGSRALVKARGHWESQLLDLNPVALYGKRGERAGTGSERVTVPLGPTRSAAIRALAQRPEAAGLTNHLSQFNVFAAALFAFLHRVSGEHRLALAAPAHNRRNETAKNTLGVFIEVFPLKVDIEAEDTFADLLGRAAKAGAGFVRHALPGASPADVNRACNVVLNYIPASFPDFDGHPMHSEWIHPGHADRAHDLRLQVHDFDETGEFVLHFDLSTERFDASERAAVTRHFVTLLDGLLVEPDQPLGAPPIIEPEEQRRLLERQAAMAEPASHDTVVARFEASAARTPDQTAIVCGNLEWSYKTLADKADRIARQLVARGAGGGTVGIVATRQAETVAGILGTLKAGAAYVPLDPTHPRDRLRFMVGETKPTVILAREADATTFPDVGIAPVSLDAILAGAETTDRGVTLPGPGARDLAYILYTSGSTGRPKGVQITHGALATYADWAARTYWKGERLSAPLFTPLTFDLTITSLITPLLVGGCVRVYPAESSAVDTSLLRVLDDNLVDVVKLTPAHLALLRDRDLSSSRIRTLVVGGSDLRVDVARAAWQAFDGRIEIYNEYGPTEATVGCMIHRYDPASVTGGSVPIGRAAAAARIYLLDDRGRPVPAGVIGEIVVGGPGVARGYLDRPDESGERFVADPLFAEEHAYRTGDLGRALPDGNIQYLGRSDRQAKIHGIRVEPGEVEAALAGLAGVDACVVDYVEADAPRETAYHCVRCGLGSDYPDVSYDDAGICSVCRTFEQVRQRALDYFQPMDRLQEILRAEDGPADFDCIMLFSGGKDSSYALYRLADMGLRILALTLDNGFISDGAKANIQRVVEDLGVSHEFVSTPSMNDVFVDSLQRHSNVCNGCFKVLYTLATNVALGRNIPFVVTGLSRGQFFETRLTEELFLGNRYETDDIDALVVEARKAYHRVDDAVKRRLDTRAFESDDVFDRVRFLDFYRYCDVELEDVLEFLRERAAWIRPEDTGRSTNCLINDVGIYVHQRERGHHNYARPYSWDVRLGHKERDAALEELDDEIDEARVHQILDQLGYTPSDGDDASRTGRLIGYVVAADDIDLSGMRSRLEARLPSFMIPADIVQIDHIPMTRNGKIDYAALPRPERAVATSVVGQVPPRDEKERWFVETWSRVLRRDTVGIHDRFFDLGGDSIAVIQIAAQAADAGYDIEPSLLFQYQTIAELATHVGERRTPVAKVSSTGLRSSEVDEMSRTKVLQQLARAERRGRRDDSGPPPGGAE